MFTGKTKYAILTAVIIAVGALVYYQTVLNRSGKTRDGKTIVNTIDPEFAGYISSFTSGFVTSNSTIKIKFTREFEGSKQLNVPLKEKYFSFEPSIEGEAVWKDAQTMEFVPKKPLKNGQVYKVTFYLKKLLEVKKELREFEFQFQTVEQSLQMEANDLKCYHSNDFSYYSLNGLITTADVAEQGLIETSLVAALENKSMNIKWVHENNGTVHRFVIDSIKRPAVSEATLILTCDGSKLNVDNTQRKEFIVPVKEKFILFNARLVAESEPYILLNFSNPVDAEHSLEGLIFLKGLKELKYIINQNQVLLYPGQVKTGSFILHVDAGVKDTKGQNLGFDSEHSIVFSQSDPAVRFSGHGNILPSTNGLSLPFETVNLKAVDVSIVKIYENNVLQFLQDNSLDGSYQLAQVGKKVVQKRINLGITNPAEYGTWKKFSLDMGSLFKAERGAIYRVSLSFKKSYSTFACLGNTFDETFEMEEVQEETEEVTYFNRYNEYEYSEYNYYEGEDGEEYNWQERSDPCKPSYYRSSDRTVTKNILASDIGITLKKGNDGSLFIVASDLVTTKPMKNVEIELYDYQKQIITSDKTDGDGQLFINPTQSPAFLVAKKDKQFAYLRFDDGATLPLSMYDVAGTAIKKGVKGFIYGERGVWRPGDSLFLNFILEDKANSLPANHPVTFSLYNPQRQLYKRIVSTSNVNGFYNFTVATDKNSPTGSWSAEVKVGPIRFSTGLRIETIMPNRLKINLDLGSDKTITASKNNNIQLSTAWLTGVLAKNLAVKLNVTLSSTQTEFPKFPDYDFDEKSTKFEAQNVSLFDGKVDDKGKATIPLALEMEGSAPGMLKATFNTMVFEPGGAFSVDRFTTNYAPYTHFAGIKLPKAQNRNGILYTGKDHMIEIATVDANGKGVSRSNMKFEMYKLEWRWWWDQYSGELANYASDEYHRPVQVQNFSSNNGRAGIKVNIPEYEWGRYLIRVVDVDGGHSSSVVTYFDWANWMERNSDNSDNKILSSMLSFSTDKTNYSSGEEASIIIPSPKNGRALITIENGSKVMEAHWLETQQGSSTFKFKITPQMAPNVYVHVSLIQPHSRTNDLPIRLYGVVPVIVNDPATHLRPQLKMEDVLEPEKEVSMTISEENKREMAFTIAVVDEGLLDITRFKTPDPHKTFYAKEALGVKTWDVYDNVIGAYGADLERILSIGGDGGELNNDAAKANRFKPMVKCFGPYFLNKGEKKTISFKMPMYVGSVRTMVIAGDHGSYGTIEKTTPVKAPLMILGTLPRVLSVTEEVKLPVTVFGGEKNIGSTDIKIEVNGLVQVIGANTKKLSIKKNDEALVLFDLKVKNMTGIAKIAITASGGGHTAKYNMELDVRNPNPYQTRTKSYTIEAGKTLDDDYQAQGVSGTNKGLLEISTIPPINLESRLNYLIAYPHGCIEQTTSQAFAQLYLSDILDLSPAEKAATENNVRNGLNELRKFQLGLGGFSYWPGNSDDSDWGTSYAGHFFLSAEKKGYSLPANMKKNWISFQQNRAQNFEINKSKYYNNDELQAYRLYVLALANSPVIGAMNRLREYKDLSNQTKWLLASAYAQIGQIDEAGKLINSASTQVPDYRVNYYTYGSHERDMAMILQTLCLMDQKQAAFNLLKKVSEYLSSNRWMSTQTTAFSLVAVSDFINRFGGSSALQAKCTLNTNQIVLAGKTGLSQVPIPTKNANAGKFSIQNNGKGVLFVSYINRGKPPIGEEKESAENVVASVVYKDMAGTTIDPSEMEQGTNFIVSVTLRNLGQMGKLSNLALNTYIPSGWEIHNSRMDENEAAMKNSSYTYQDVRDDRVFTYFDLLANESKTFNIMVNASYEGSFYLPGISAEAMYDNTVFANTKGKWVRVVKVKNAPVAEK